MQREKEAQRQFDLDQLAAMKEREQQDLAKKNEHQGRAFQTKALKEQ